MLANIQEKNSGENPDLSESSKVEEGFSNKLFVNVLLKYFQTGFKKNKQNLKI